MADDLKITAFLELKDNLSSGLSKVASDVNNAAKATEKVTAALNKIQPPRDLTTGRFLKKGSPEYIAAMKGMTELDEKTLKNTSSFAKLGTTASNVFGGLKTGATAAAAVLATVGLAYYKVISVSKEFENNQIRIAGTLKALNVAPTWKMAEAETARSLKRIQEQAAALPGETSDYITVFSQAVPKIIESGMSDMRAATDLSSRYTAVAISNTVDAQQAGMDLFRMLAGQAGADVRMWTVLSAHIGMNAKEFNKLAASVRLSKIDEAISKFNDQLTAAGSTFDAKFGEMQSRLNEIVRIGGEPMFESAKESLTAINALLSEGQEGLIGFANTIATTLGDTLEGMVGAASNMAKAMGMMDRPAAGRNGTKTLEELLAERAKLAEGTVFSPVTLGKIQRLDRKIAKLRAQELERGTTLMKLDPHLEEYERTHAGMTKIRQMPPAARLVQLWQEKFFDKPGKLGFESAEQAWEKYAEALGLESEERLAIWQHIKSGAKGMPALPAKETVVNFNNNRFDIRQAFAEGFDPDRIAVAFASDLGRLGEFQMQSPLAPYAGVH